MKKIVILFLSVSLIVLNGCADEACCKECSTGKACGDSCISKGDTCNEGEGCACDV